jgi:predicted permease
MNDSRPSRPGRPPPDGDRGRLRGSLGPDRSSEIREEIRFYLEERAKEFEASGMSPAEAVRAARAAFGDPELVAARLEAIERVRRREEGTRMLIETTVRELRHAARGLSRNATFTGVVIATLALGIGAVTAVFSVVNASLVRALPFPEDDRLVFLQGAYDAPEGPQVRGASPAEARDWESMSRSFAGVAAFDGASYTLTGNEGDAERVAGETIDEGYLEILAVEPIAGRAFAPEEYAPGNGRQLLLVGEDLWTRRWGRDPSLVGRSVLLDGEPFTVVGVLPGSFGGVGFTSELWVPFASVLSEAGMWDRGDRWTSVLARLRNGVDLEQAQADMDAVASRLEETHPVDNLDRIALVRPVRDVLLGTTRPLMLVVLGATGLLLLIAAANVANLLLVRAWARAPETLLRRALGAGRVVLARQAITESMLLAVMGAGLGLVLGVWGASALAAATPDALLPVWVVVTPDIRVFVMVAGLMALLGLLTGVVPALLGDRVDVASGLGVRGATGRAGGRSRLQAALVAGEVTLAMILMVGAGLMVRSLRAQLAVDPGFDAEQMLVFSLMLPSERYPDDATRRAAMETLMPRLAAEPGVLAVTFAADAPLRGGWSATYLWTGEGGGTEDRIRFYFHRVQPGWFETMGVPIEQGRALEPSDATSGLNEAVISRAMAERHFGGVDPVGRSLFVGRPDGNPITIVGVAGDVRWRDLTTDLVGGPDDPDVYVAWPRLPGFRVEVALRSRGAPDELTGVVRRVVREVDPELVPDAIAPMTEVLRTQTAQGRFGSLLLTAFSTLAAALAAVGLYGVLSFMVGRRTREIAVRMAMGADGARLRRMVVAQGLQLALLGIVLGIGTAVVASRAIRAFLFGVSPLDPMTYLSVATLMAAVTALAAWIPARRATRVDPHVALSSD